MGDERRQPDPRPPSRRRFLRDAALYGGGVLLASSLQGLVAACARARVSRTAPRAGPGDGGYGDLVVAGPELALPVGFTYVKLGVEGTPMSDGLLTPRAHDGMAAFALPNGNVRLVRNHEDRERAATARARGDAAKAYDPRGGGGTTSLEVRIAPDGGREIVRDFMSLGGTIVNCAGGLTPWGTWLTCEETTQGAGAGFEREHGYVFEVPALAEEEVRAVPLKALGRFVHEAVALDAASGIVYLTEDWHRSGFYRFLPDHAGDLAAGGRLQMLAAEGAPNLDTGTGRRTGERRPVTWVAIDDPDPPDAETNPAAVFEQGFARGGARFARLEGAWAGDGGIYFQATSGGDAGCGQVWHYRPRGADPGELALVFESPGRDWLDGPDNITVSPRGGVLICEDGRGTQHLRGLTRDGAIFDFARNTLNANEFAGACFHPDGSTLFVNIQGNTRGESADLGMTFAIWGPWERGAL